MDGEQGEEESLPEWPLFTLKELAYKDLSPSMGNGRGIKARECLKWKEFIPKLIQNAGKCFDYIKCGEFLQLLRQTTQYFDQTFYPHRSTRIGGGVGARNQGQI